VNNKSENKLVLFISKKWRDNMLIEDRQKEKVQKYKKGERENFI
jgi:hypothetical protein